MAFFSGEPAAPHARHVFMENPLGPVYVPDAMTYRLVAFALLGFFPQLFAGDNGLQVITLKDTSVIRAHVTEMSGGFYLVKSPVLGEMKIPTAEVVSILPEDSTVPSTGAPPPAGNGTAQPSATAAGLDSLRSALSSKVKDLVSTRDGMNAVMSFSQNPDLKAALNDPQVMQAIQNRDYNALMKSPTMKSLLDNPRTKELIQSILHQKSQAPIAPPGEPSPPAE